MRMNNLKKGSVYHIGLTTHKHTHRHTIRSRGHQVTSRMLIKESGERGETGREDVVKERR